MIRATQMLLFFFCLRDCVESDFFFLHLVTLTVPIAFLIAESLQGVELQQISTALQPWCEAVPIGYGETLLILVANSLSVDGDLTRFSHKVLYG